MARTLGAGLLAIAALAATSLGGIAWLTRGATGSDAAPPAAADTAAVVPAAGLDAAAEALPQSGGASGVPAEPPPAVAERSAHAGPGRVAVMPPERRRALRSFRREVAAGLSALRDTVADCATPAGAPSVGPRAGHASFVLDVETVEGGIRIVDASLEGEGTPDDPGAACARAVLRGHVIPAPSAEPGRRWKLPFSP